METTSSSINYPKPSKNENVEIFVRLRGYTKLPTNFIKGHQSKKESKANSNLETNSNNQRIKNIKSTTESLQNKKPNYKNKNLTEPNENKKKLIFNYLYYMFTSYPKCNKIVITQDALNGTCIMNSVRNERDIIDINKTILGNASIYEYDNCFCETEDLCDVYLQTVESKIIKLFQGINSCFFVAGPSRSGKSYTMFGTIKIKGVIAYTIDKILYLIDYMNNNNNNTENENENENNNNNEDNFEKDDSNENNENNNSKLMLSFIIEQYYLDEKEIIFEETIIFEVKDFYSIIANLQQRRRDLAQMHNIQYMESKSNLLLTFTLYKINSKTDIKKLIENKTIEELKEENSIEPFSKISFIELNDSLYGFAPASAPTTILYRESSKVYNDIVNISIALSKGNYPEIIRTKMLTELCENVIFKNSHIMILICASPCDPNINVSGNCLIWGYSLRNRLNFSKMINKGYFITNCPSIYVDNNKFKENCLRIVNFNFSIIEKKKRRKYIIKINNIENKTKENFRDKIDDDNLDNIKNDTEKRFQTESNWLFNSTNNSDNNLISKYKLLQKEIDKIKKQRQIENKQNSERFKSLEKLIQKVKKNNKEIEDNL
jgi:hypothetical protein